MSKKQRFRAYYIEVAEHDEFKLEVILRDAGYSFISGEDEYCSMEAVERKVNPTSARFQTVEERAR